MKQNERVRLSDGSTGTITFTVPGRGVGDQHAVVAIDLLDGGGERTVHVSELELE